ncbi:hypothetical protein GCM10009838_39780 [Catenulispora subtropica]|uniref:Uncharacterized protein n=1 Tax=Catenulispora subtropica TaxID=450798 RepID=A0ABP5D839_9ACTN
MPENGPARIVEALALEAAPTTAVAEIAAIAIADAIRFRMMNLPFPDGMRSPPQVTPAEPFER